MEQELNYLSEKIEELESKIAKMHDYLDSGLGTGGRIGEEYREKIKDYEKEKNLLDNILSALTINELK